MAAAITTTATNAEGQLVEIARALQLLEAAQSTDETPINNVQIAADVENGNITITAVLPANLGGTGGAFTMTATEYLS